MYYFHHAESCCVFKDERDISQIPNDGCVEPITYERYLELIQEYEDEEE